ncbi:MAG: LURP-one-related/scramblase family protein [Thermomicrobiales bacterium]
MRYLLQQRLVRIWKPTDITDETGAVAFRTELAESNTYAIYDAAGNGVAQVHQKPWQILGETFVISCPNDDDVTMRKHFAPLHPRFDITLPDGVPLILTGNLSSHEFTLTRSGDTIATVSRSWSIVSRDTYGVEVAEGEAPPLVLGIVLALELAQERQ